MNNRKYSLREVCYELSDGLHKAPEFNPFGEYLFVNATNLENGKIVDKNDGKRSDYEEFVKYGIELNDDTILYSIDGTIGNMAFYRGEKCILGKGACYLKIKQNFDKNFVYYLLQSAYFSEYIKLMSTGSTIHHISLETMRSFVFQYPDLCIQRKIGDILKKLEIKIDINSSICSELESMAKTIYDYWFVQFDFPDENGKPYRTSGGEMVWNEQLQREIPKGWKAKNIQEVCAIVDCLHSKKPDLSFESENYYLLQLDNLVDMGLLDLSNKYYVSANDYAAWTSKIEVRCGDLVITNAGRVGDIARIPEGIICGIGRNMTAIRAVNVDPIFMYYFFASSDMKAQIKSNTDTGSFFGSLNVRGIKQLIMPIPPEKSEIINRFIDIVRPIRENLEMITLQSQELSKLRDWLLPMLMNGQARVE